MQIQTTHLGLRIAATLLAIGYGVVGCYVLAISGDAPTAHLGDRAFWMGTTFVIAAVLAVVVSWLVADLSNIWCVPPRRTPQPRLKLDNSKRSETIVGAVDPQHSPNRGEPPSQRVDQL